MMKRYYILSVLVLLCGIVMGQNLDKSIPVDKNIKIGKLDNQLTYYICKNKELKNRASFYLIENVGAIVEEDNQNGLAHFLEHMGLNGLKHFPGNEMDKCLNRHGIKFGEGMNAFTSQTETYYKIINAPLDHKNMTDTCMLVLSDLADGIMFNPEEIEKEKGVIIEEWRQTNTLQSRVQKRLMQNLYNNSLYAKRDIIGDMDIVRNANRESLLKFYNDWYRPDLQAVVVVGDIDVKEIEAKIKEYFGGIKAVDNPRPKPEITIADNKEINYNLIDEKGISGTIMEIAVRQKSDNNNYNTYGYAKANMLRDLFNTMIKNRIAAASRNADKNYQFVSMSRQPMVQPYMSYTITLSPKVGKSKEALKEVLAINQSIIKDGFRADEFLRAKSDLLFKINDINTERVSNESIVKKCMEHYLRQRPLTDQKKFKPALKKIINKIKVQEVNDLIKKWYVKDNMSVSIVCGRTDDPNILSKAEVIECLNKTDLYFSSEDSNSAETKVLLDAKPKGGKIVKVEKITKFGAEIWTLSNGAKVAYRYCNSNPGAAGFWGESKGGTAAMDVKDLPLASWTNEVLSLGLGEHDKFALQKILQDKNLRFNTMLSNIKEMFEGVSSKEDFEYLLQVIYMAFEQPKFDKQAFDVMYEETMNNIPRIMNDPQKALSDNISLIMTDNHERTFVEDSASLANIKLEDLKRVYTDRFSNAADWKFFLVGDINKNVAKKLVSQYIGAIKSTDIKEEIIDHKVSIPKGYNRRIIDIDMGKEVSINTIVVKNVLAYNSHNKYCMQLFSSILNARLSSVIREQEGGTYGISVRPGMFRVPSESFDITIEFQCSLENQQKLLRMVREEIGKIAKDGVTDDEIKDVKTYVKKSLAQRRKNVNYWYSALKNYVNYNEDITDASKYENVLYKLTTEDVKSFTNKFLKDSDCLEIIIQSKK